MYMYICEYIYTYIYTHMYNRHGLRHRRRATPSKLPDHATGVPGGIQAPLPGSARGYPESGPDGAGETSRTMSSFSRPSLTPHPEK